MLPHMVYDLRVLPLGLELLIPYRSKSLRVFCDNSTAVFMAKNNKSGSRNKHIDIKYLAIKEVLEIRK